MTRKTSAQISEMIIIQLETSLNRSIPILPKSFVRVLAKVLGGVFVLLYQYASWIMLQMFVKTASNVEVTIGGVTLTPLKLWGELVEIFQKPGQRAELNITITVLNQTGSLTSGTRFINPVTKMIYVLIGDVPLDAATKTATIRAVDVGELGNMDEFEEIHFMNPPSSVEKVATVTTTSASGVDTEDTEVFRERILERYAARPQGGAYADYKDWAEEVVGVRNAYPYSGWYDITIPDSHAGQVFVFVESASDNDGIPPAINPDGSGRPSDPESSGVCQDVWEHLEGDGTTVWPNRRNINAYVKVFPISRTAFDVDVIGLVSEDEDAAKTAIQDALTQLFLDFEPFITGVSLMPKEDIISDGIVAGVAARIAAAYGGYIKGVEVSGLTQGYYQLQEGEKAKLGQLSWVQ